MDPEALRKLKESEEEMQRHETSKTTHFAKLGKAFARPAGASLFSPSGRGGRGVGSIGLAGRGIQR